MENELDKIVEEKANERVKSLSITFDKPITQNEEKKDTATNLVEQAFNQAVVHKVSTDESVQKELLESAEKVIKNKTNEIKEKADQEEKEAFFNNRKGACDCFGYDEATTPKWAVWFMNLWYNTVTAIWIFIGCFTFAPVVFTAKKIIVIFKKTWLAIVFALIIYFSILAIPFLVGLLKK
jgi:hypothetical protein